MAIDISKISQKSNQKATPKSFGNIEINLFDNKLSDKKKDYFYTQVHMLLSSGIDLKSALEIYIEDLKNNKDIQLFTDIHNKIVGGTSIYDALKESGKFSEYDCYSLKVAEETGRLNEVLEELKHYYSKKIKLRRQFISALTYPTIVILTAILAVSFMMKVIVPMFASIYKRSNIELPKITKSIISISETISDSIIYIFLIIIILSVLHIIYKKESKYKEFTSKIILRIPLFGKIIKMIFLERFFQSMCLLMASKISILNSIQITKNMIRFYPIQDSLNKIEVKILEGLSLNECMSSYKIYDKRTLSFIKVGEETNNMETAFKKLQDLYSNEIDHLLGILQSMIEPILIIFIGVFVGIILVSMYLPMFQIGNAF